MLIEAGEPLGTRYVVVHTVPDPRVGDVFETADQNGMKYFGQLVAPGPVPPALAAEIRQSVVSLPALPCIQRPRDLALTPRAMPVALLERPGGLAPIAVRLDAMVASLGKREATQWLLRQIAAVATDLSQIHQAGIVHGAISATVLLCAAEGEVGNLQLSGWGINPFERQNDPTQAPSRRADLVSLLNALHQLFTAAGLAPEGGAAAKWMLLRASAQHGEHPALASGSMLAIALTEMATLRTDEAPTRTLRPPSVAPPARAGASSRAPEASQPTAARRDSGRAARDAKSTDVPPPPRVEAPRASPRVHLGFVLPVVALIALLVGGAVWYALSARDDIGIASLRTRRRNVAAPRAVCPGESTGALDGLRDLQAPAEFDVACTGTSARLILLGRKGTEVAMTSRGAQRGARYSDVVTLTRGAVEFGSSLTRDGVVWATWRNGVGDPFGIARIDGDRVVTTPVPMQGWDSVPLHGAWLVQVDTRHAWIVTNIASTGAARAMLLQVTFGPAAPEVTSWVLGQGAVEAFIDGASPTVLLRTRVEGAEPVRHELRTLRLNLAVLAATRRPADPVSVRGSTLPETAVTRSTAQVLDGASIGTARRGLSIGSRTLWLVARGGVRPTDTCTTPEQCHTAGPVALLAFGEDGIPTLTQVVPSGWAVALAATPEGAVECLVTTANVAGVEVPYHALYTVSAEGALAATHAEIAVYRAPRTTMLRCGNETWAVFDAVQPAAVLSARPFTCVRAAP